MDAITTFFVQVTQVTANRAPIRQSLIFNSKDLSFLFLDQRDCILERLGDVYLYANTHKIAFEVLRPRLMVNIFTNGRCQGFDQGEITIREVTDLSSDLHLI